MLQHQSNCGIVLSFRRNNACIASKMAAKIAKMSAKIAKMAAKMTEAKLLLHESNCGIVLPFRRNNACIAAKMAAKIAKMAAKMSGAKLCYYTRATVELFCLCVLIMANDLRYKTDLVEVSNFKMVVCSYVYMCSW